MIIIHNMNMNSIFRSLLGGDKIDSGELIHPIKQMSHLTDEESMKEKKEEISKKEKEKEKEINKKEINLQNEYFVLMIHNDYNSNHYGDSNISLVKKYPWLSIRSKYCNSHPLGKYTNSEEAVKQLEILKKNTELPTGTKFSIKKLTDYEIIKFIKLSCDSSNNINEIPIEDNRELELKAQKIYSHVKDNTFYDHGMVKCDKIILLDNQYKGFIIQMNY